MESLLWKSAFKLVKTVRLYVWVLYLSVLWPIKFNKRITLLLLDDLYEGHKKRQETM